MVWSEQRKQSPEHRLEAVRRERGLELMLLPQLAPRPGRSASFLRMHALEASGEDSNK